MEIVVGARLDELIHALSIRSCGGVAGAADEAAQVLKRHLEVIGLWPSDCRDRRAIAVASSAMCEAGGQFADQLAGQASLKGGRLWWLRLLMVLSRNFSSSFL